ncbi:hypothetical protein TorRG33x02_155470 [Trema orientale]|uniref:Uncharacterized protein n=1 Tax=Trema orientale TaxID=63057 RepID=A0A2P5ESW5_TREOI|nr:hypothetical protein TorRG33x02_155470 [Trema orientale]
MERSFANHSSSESEEDENPFSTCTDYNAPMNEHGIGHSYSPERRVEFSGFGVDNDDNMVDDDGGSGGRSGANSPRYSPKARSVCSQEKTSSSSKKRKRRLSTKEIELLIGIKAPIFPDPDPPLFHEENTNAKKRKLRIKEIEQLYGIAAPIFPDPDPDHPTATPTPTEPASSFGTQLSAVVHRALSYESLANQVPSLRAEIEANRKKIAMLELQISAISSERDHAVLAEARSIMEMDRRLLLERDGVKYELTDAFQTYLNLVCGKYYCQGYKDAKDDVPPAVSLEDLDDASSTD